jgi:hypothetical protein
MARIDLTMEHVTLLDGFGELPFHATSLDALLPLSLKANCRALTIIGLELWVVDSNTGKVNFSGAQLESTAKHAAHTNNGVLKIRPGW